MQNSIGSVLPSGTPILDSVVPSQDALGVEPAIESLDRLISKLGQELQPPSYLPRGNTVANETIVVSIVMPCLNEADTLATCIDKAKVGLAGLSVAGEIIVADNGSTDGSREIAIDRGVRLIDVSERGYGSALMAGIEAARGEFVIMGDADDSYDFREVPNFVKRLQNGADLAQGCRLPQGGGKVMPGAMPWLHRWIGNPVLTWLAVRMFGAPVNDVYCGMRGFRKAWYQRLEQRCTGMEFAVEMIVKGSLFGTNIQEVPISLHPDGRKAHRPHLRTFRDGWRTLRFFLLHCPTWTFFVPGLAMIVMGILGYLLALPQIQIGPAVLSAHTLLVSTLAALIGSQLVACGVFAKTFAGGAKLLPLDPKLERFLGIFNLERQLMVSTAIVCSGLGLIAWTAWSWALQNFGPLDYEVTMRRVIPGVGLVALGVQLAATSFMLSILRITRK